MPPSQITSNTGSTTYETRKRQHEAFLHKFGNKIEDFLTNPEQRINPLGSVTEFRHHQYIDDKHRKMNFIHPVYNGMSNVHPVVEKKEDRKDNNMDERYKDLKSSYFSNDKLIVSDLRATYSQMDHFDNAILAAAYNEEVNKERQRLKEQTIQKFQDQVKKRVTERTKQGKYLKERSLIAKEIHTQEIRERRTRMEEYGRKVSEENKKRLTSANESQVHHGQHIQGQQNFQLKHEIPPLRLPLSATPDLKQSPPSSRSFTTVTSKMSSPSLKSVKTVFDDNHAYITSEKTEKLSDRVFIPSSNMNTICNHDRVKHDQLVIENVMYNDQDSNVSSTDNGKGTEDNALSNVQEQFHLLLQCASEARKSLMSHSSKGKKPIQTNELNSRLFQREINVEDNVVYIYAPKCIITEDEQDSSTLIGTDLPQHNRKRAIPLIHESKTMCKQSPQNKEMQNDLLREQQKYLEERRYLEALREQFINKIREKNVEIPPLCTCQYVKPFDDTSKHARNCTFYRNPKEHARALSSILTSLHPKYKG